MPWPGGIGSPGNEGVAGSIRTTENAVGYITLAYALQNDIPTAHIQNGDHTNFVAPSLDTASAASGSAAFWLPAAHDSWEQVDLLAAPGLNSYPITSFSYLIVHPELNRSTDNEEHARALLDMIAWMITDGQQLSPRLGYVPIADLVSNIGLQGLSEITYNGETLYDGPVNVWESDTTSSVLDSWLDDITQKYDDGEIDQSTFLNLMAQAAQLHAMVAEDLINSDELDDALANIVS